MSDAMFLSAEELQGMTNKKSRPSQITALNHMGITHKVRPDGSIAVLRSHAFKEFDGDTRERKKLSERPQFNVEAMNARFSHAQA